VRAVDRALDILLAFKEVDGTLSVAELLDRLDLRRPTLYRLLHTLAQKGFVVSSGDPLKFRLGPSVAQLAHSWNASTRLSETAEPAMRRVWEVTGETVALFVPEGVMRTCVAEIPSQEALSFKRGVGYQERLVLGASGLPILAHMEGNLDLTAYATGLDVDIEKCRDELDKVRRRGYAVSRGQLIDGAVAIAAPIFDAHDRVVGALGIFGPSVRLRDAVVSEYGSLLVREAASVSTALGKVDVTRP
jgi:DNA-binding IclR family transcriptional regulator